MSSHVSILLQLSVQKYMLFMKEQLVAVSQPHSLTSCYADEYISPSVEDFLMTLDAWIMSDDLGDTFLPSCSVLGPTLDHHEPVCPYILCLDHINDHLPNAGCCLRHQNPDICLLPAQYERR